MHRYKKDFQEIWKSLKRMFHESALVRWTTWLSIFFWAAAAILPIWRLMPLAKESPFIALHYNIYLGVDRFGPIWRVFFIPALGLFFLLFNLLIQAWTWRKQKILSIFFAAVTPFLQFILLVAMGLIILINL